jgi:NTP pyrophosphatase (non-canonical NTP hydrolase)
MNKNYREIVIKTSKNSAVDAETGLLLAALGLCIESGEFADFIKKNVFHNQELDRENMIKKLGDIRWFLELAAERLGLTMDEIESKNVSKLMTRYPELFK